MNGPGWTHAERSRPALLERLDGAATSRPVARLRDPLQVARFVRELDALSLAGRPGEVRRSSAGPGGTEGRGA